MISADLAAPMQRQSVSDLAAAASAGPIIAVHGLAKSYGTTKVLGQVDLEVRRGEFLSLLGPSGSGKTTLLNLIAGIVLPSAGRIELDGRDISHTPPEARDIGVVFQNYALFPHLSVQDNVAFPLRMRGQSRAKRNAKAMAALDLVKLTPFAKRFPTELSGGQQQRVALARALVFDPAILLMDEPLSALDKKLREHMKGELRQLQQRLGLTVVYVTHDQSEALALSTRIALMKDGKIVQLGTPQEIYEKPRSRFAADFVGETNLLEAHILGWDDDRLVLCLGEAQLRARLEPQDVGLSIGRQTLVLIRPEHVVLGSAARRYDNHFTGRIDTILYEGASRVLTVDIGPVVLRVRTSTLIPETNLAEGETVELGWSSHFAHVVDPDAH